MKVAKTLIIGIGTSGQNVCEGLANNLNSKYGDYKKATWIGIRVLETAHKSDVLDKGDFIGLSVDQSAFSDYISGATHVGRDFGWNDWGDPNLLKNVGACINVGAGNIRMAGRLSLFHNYAFVSGNITAELERLNKLTPAEIQKVLDIKDNIDVMPGGIQVFVIGSLCGGTGSGCCADLGYLLRIWGNQNVAPMAIFTIPHWSLQAQRLKKNAFIALTELNHYMLNDSVWTQKLPGFANPANDQRKPYDVIYLTQPATGGTDQITRNECTIASFLSAVCTETSQDIAAANVDGINALATNRQLGYLSPSFSSFGISVLEYPGEHISRMCKERLLQKVYGTWKDDPSKDISLGRTELFEKTPKLVADKFYEQSIISKYEVRMKEEFEKQKFPKNASIHNQMDTIFASINREILEDVDIKKKADFWIENFLSGLEDRFLKMADKYIASVDSGPGFLARILKQGKEDIDAWAMPKGEIDKAYSSAKLTADTTRKNIKKQTDDYLNIKGFFVGNKQKEAWNGVVAKAISYVKELVKLVATGKMKDFVDSMAYGNNTIQNKYNLFADKYMTRLDNFESALGALYRFHESEYNKNIDKVPLVNGKQIYKNNSATDEVEEIYNMVVKDSSNNPNLTIEKREVDMASSIIYGLKQDLISKLTGTISCFDSRIMADVKDYFADDFRKTVDLKANSFFADLSKYRHILYSINDNPSSDIAFLQMRSKPSIESSTSPIPVKFQNDPAVGNISVTNYNYAFCPKQEGPLANRETITNVVQLLSSVQLRKPVFENQDPYRIMALQMCHGTSLAHMNGILKRNDSDMQALEDSMICNDFTNWNTRIDVPWKNCLISKDVIDKIKKYWIVYRLIGNYRDSSGNFIIFDREGNPSPWYEISQGKVVVEIISDNIVVKKEKIDLNVEEAVMDIASNPSKQRAIEATCQNKIKTYFAQIGKKEFVETLFKCLNSLDSYYMNITKEIAEKCIIGYCFANGLETEYINFKFPVDKPIDATQFSQLYQLSGPLGAGYYCPNGHKLGTDDVQSTLRSMIQNRFKCPSCTTDTPYWPY